MTKRPLTHARAAIPNKRVRLALWWMLYRVPIDVDAGSRRDWQIRCAAHIKWDMETFNDMTRVFPRHWQRMLDKRARRLAYAKDHGGECPSGWTPPAQGETIRNAPLFALAKRHRFGLAGVAFEQQEARELNYRAKHNLPL